MNPVFVFLVIVGAALLWVLLSGLFRLIGSMTQHTINKTKDALNNDDRGNVESFIDGFKHSIDKNKGE